MVIWKIGRPRQLKDVSITESDGDIVERKSRHERSQKKSLGSFYTPSYLAELIANESLNTWLRNHSHNGKRNLLKLMQDLKILDPSVGAGAFLLAAAKWLDNKRQEFGDGLSSIERRESIVKDSLFGVDLVTEAVDDCRTNLLQWISSTKRVNDNIRQGNSLNSYDWFAEFPSITIRDNPGFDIILGNPPYGNILSIKEREFIRANYPYVVGGTRLGTWNSAAHFIVRSSMLLRQRGELGFLIPNSILRVKQFTKARKYLIEDLNLWKIVDEGSPFEDVTLEMVTIFCSKQKPSISNSVQVESRRPGYKQKNSISLKLLQTSEIFPLYHDEIFEAIVKKGQKKLIVASRGRDIPKAHVKNEAGTEFAIPYITSGRSVRRYRIDRRYQTFTDTWYLRDLGMVESFSKELLVATKNYKYPRCVIKPVGTIHGGGIVHIKPKIDDVNLRALGLILNSNLIQYICTRYLTNYSQLTTCLNTGIMEELPLILPKYPDIYAILFDTLSLLHNGDQSPELEYCIVKMEQICEALVYELYFGSDDELQKEVARLLKTRNHISNDIQILCGTLECDSVISLIEKIHRIPNVRRIEKRLNEGSGKSPRY